MVFIGLAYWDPRDRTESVEVDYEVHIDGLPNTCGLAATVAKRPDTLIDLTTTRAIPDPRPVHPSRWRVH